MNSQLTWNQPLTPVDSADTSAIVFNMNQSEGYFKAEEKSLTVANGYVLKAGTPLVESTGGVLLPHTGYSEQQKWVLDGDIVPTATKDTVLTVAGITLTFTGTMTVAKLMKVLKGAKPGQTGATIVANSGQTGVAGSGTLAGWYPIVDTSRNTVLWVASTFNTNVTNLSFTLVDTAASPVNLASHVTATTVSISSAKVVGILVNPVNTVSAAKRVPVFTCMKGYANMINMATEPDSETATIDGALPEAYALGIFTQEQLNLCLMNTEFELVNSFSAL